MNTAFRRYAIVLPLLTAFSLSCAAADISGDGSKTGATQTIAPAYDLPLIAGPFQPNVDSLKTYRTPDWFRDAKFGIWAHWGPQAVPRAGDWYARNMYIPGTAQYEHHLKR